MPSINIPSAESPFVTRLTQALAIESQPILVKHEPLKGKPLKECFPIVAEHVEKCGGKPVFGWALIELTGIWIEAEFHAVWQRPDGSMVDIAPREFSPKELLFLPDKGRKYEGIQVASHFMPLTQNPAVLRHIQLASEFFHETNKGELAYAQSYTLTPRIAQIQAEMHALLQRFPWH